MHRRRLTRRQAVQAGSAALAAGFLRPLPALAAPASLFELKIDDALDGGTAAGWRTTRVRPAPRRFDLLGLRWAPGESPRAQVRVRRRGSGWSDWLALHSMGSHAPDSGAPAGTEPAYTGAADFFQLRLRGSARGLRVRFVRAQPSARVARRLSARANISQSAPQIISRETWGAAAVPPRATPSYGVVQLAFVHHTATGNEYGPEESAGIVLGIARYHRDSNGWNDIGYNFLVDKYGQVFEGRAGGVDQPVIGAQAQGYNAASTGIACLGDFSAIVQSPAAMESLARLLAWKLGIHGVPVEGQVTVTSAGGPSNRYGAGTPVTYQRISGHRDGNNTSCPGQLLYDQLPALRARTAGLARPASSLTIALAGRTVRHPGAARLSGSLAFADGRPVAGASLRIELLPSGGATWQPVGAASASGDGRWRAEIGVPRSGRLRAVWDGDGTLATVVSAAASVTVLPRLSVRGGASRMRAGRVLRVRGRIAPVPDSSRVTLVLERRGRRGWVQIRSRRIGVRDGDFDLRLRLPVRGLYRVSVSAPGAVERRFTRVVG